MTTRITALQVAIKNYQDGGLLALTARNVAEAAVIKGLDALRSMCRRFARFDQDLMFTSSFVPVSTNRGESKLDTLSIMGIGNNTSAELDVHLNNLANSYDYEVYICTGTGVDDRQILAGAPHHHADRSDDRHGV